MAEAGLSVVLLERGGWPDFEETRPRRTDQPADDGPRECLRPRRRAPSPRRRRTRNGNRAHRPAERGRLQQQRRLRRFGHGELRRDGLALHGAGLPHALHLRRARGSTLEDWPITYADLEPCYEKAEWEIGVSGDDGLESVRAPRAEAAARCRRFPYNLEARILEPAAKRLGLHPFPIPMLRNSVPYGGRPACMRCRYCVGFACEVNAKCGTHNTVIPRAHGNGQLRGADPMHGQRDGGRRARARPAACAISMREDRLSTRPADLVVVSCAAIETARLLLNSKLEALSRRRRQPPRLGGAQSAGARLHRRLGPVRAGYLRRRRRRAPTIAICDFNHGNPGLAGGGMLANEFIRLPYLFTAQRPPGAPRWGKAHKDFQRRLLRRSVVVSGPVQEMPVFDARVEADPG